MKLGFFTFWDFASISQLRNEGYCAAKWHSCAKSWFRSCETPCGMELWLRNWEFSCFGASQLIRSFEMGALVLRSGTRVPKLLSQLRNALAETSTVLRNVLATKCRFRRGCEISQTPVFALFLLCFCSERLPFNFFAFSPDFDHPKTYITSKQIKALKSKLKQVKKIKQKDMD